jgi:hypothetical protein
MYERSPEHRVEAGREMMIVHGPESQKVQGGGIGAFLAEIGGAIVRGARALAANTCTNPYCSCMK